jgi:hypothetical protein
MEIKPMYRGDSRILHLGVDTDITGGKIYIIVKHEETDPDNQALINKLWTLDAPVSGGQNNGKIMGASVEILPSESATFPVGTVYVGIEYVASGGRTYTLHSGPMQVLRDLRQTVG